MSTNYIVLKFKLNPNKTQTDNLNLMFKEADALWNNIVSNSLTDDKLSKNFKTEMLGSQFKQEMFREFIQLLKSQKALKNLRKSGLIKYKRKFTISVFSNQPISILENKIQIQKLGKISSRGNKSNLKYLEKLKAKEIISDFKCASFQILKRTTGFYIHCIVKLENYNSDKYKEYSQIGIDLGIKDNMVLSDTTAINWEVNESKQLKKYQKKLSKLKKDNPETRARFLKLAFMLRREHEKLSFKKKHIVDSLINLFKKFEIVAIQDELIKLWHEGYFGKQVQHRFYGKIYERLKLSDNIIVVESETPTTKTCHRCGNIQPMSLESRQYNCKSCKLKIDRDLNSSINILQNATNQMINYQNIKKNNIQINSIYIKIA